MSRREEKYIVAFNPSLEETKELKRVLDFLTKEDSTFSYSRKLNFFSLEDSDRTRVFRRGMWIKKQLGKRGIELDFTFLKFREKR